jgi:hypothetical protein
MTNSELHLFFWGQPFADPAHAPGVAALTEAAGVAVGPDGTAGIAQYGVGPGRVADTRIIDFAPPNEVGTDRSPFSPAAEFVSGLMSSVGPLYWWVGGPAPLYVVFVDKSQVGSGDFEGYHSVVPSPGWMLPFPLDLFTHDFMPFALSTVPDGALSVTPSMVHDRDSCLTTMACWPPIDFFDLATTTLSHEIFEALTDPYPGLGWSAPNADDLLDELSDVCDEVQMNRWTRVGDDVFDTVWSVAANDCVGPWLPSVEITSPSAGQTFAWQGGLGIHASAVPHGAVDRGARAASDLRWRLDGIFLPNGGPEVDLVPAPGSHHLEVVMTDSSGLVVSAAVDFLVTLASPVAVIDAPADGSSFPIDQLVTLRGHGTSADYPFGVPPGWLVWKLNGVMLGAGSVLATRLGPAGDATLTLSFVDAFGVEAIDTRRIHLLPPTGGPSIAIVSPAEPATSTVLVGSCTDFSQPCYFAETFVALATDANGSWLYGSQVQWTATLAPGSGLDYPPLSLGSGRSVSVVVPGFWCTAIVWEITATATDLNGRTASATITFYSGSIGC